MMSEAVQYRSACPACSAPDAPVLIPDLDLKSPALRRYFSEFYAPAVAAHIESLDLPPASVRACATCGTIFHSVVPSPGILAGFYSTLQSSYDGQVQDIQPDRAEQRLLELMMCVRFLQKHVARPSVLDFGTGDGSWAKLSAAVGCRTTATDTASEAFPGLERAGIECLPPDLLPAATFDLINVEQVFEHLPDPASQLAALVASLRPGGLLKIGVPHDPRLRQKLRSPDWTAGKSSPDSLNAVAPIEHLNAFTPAGLDRLAGNAGLIPLDIRGWSLIDPRDPPPRTPRGILVRLLRDRLGQRHQPPYALAQTRFFQLPA